MNKITINTLEELNNLGSALTIEGLTENSFQDLIDWVKQYTPLKNERVYVTKGITMNNLYHLSGNNRYPNDVNIVSISLDDMENFNAITIPRFQIGGRWLSDIIDNNIKREREKE